MNTHLLTAAAMACLLAACTTVDKKALTDAGDDSTAVDHEQRGELMYQMLVAEMAGRRGRVDLAMDGYLKASRAIDDPRLAERAARLAVYAKAWDSAFEAGQRWVALEPDNLNAHRLMVGVHLKRADVTASADSYERILALTEQSFDVGAASVLTSLVREPRLPLAVQVAQELSGRHPDSAMGHFLVARLAAADGQQEVALQAYDRCLAIKPDMGRANLYRAQLKSSMGRTGEALGDLQAHLQRNPDDIVSQLGLSRLLIEVGRHAEAEAHAETLYQRYPDRGEVMFDIGLMAIDSKRFEAAQRYLQRSVELDHKRDDANYFIARVAQTRRDYDAAISAYDQVTQGQYHLDAGLRAAQLAARSASLEVGLARLATLSGNFDSAEAVQQLAMTEADMLQQAGREQEALEVLNQALQAQPQDGDLRYARGLAAERAGQLGLFEQDMRDLLEADPNNAHAMNALGYSLVERGERLAEAKVLIAGALQLRPDDPAIIDSMGWLHFKMGDYPQSIQYLRRAFELLNDPEIAAHLGEALWLSGEREEAQKVLEIALSASPDDARLQAVQRKFTP